MGFFIVLFILLFDLVLKDKIPYPSTTSSNQITSIIYANMEAKNICNNFIHLCNTANKKCKNRK